MEIEEKAKNYAEGKAISAITAAIEKAFIDGYESGFHDGVAKSKQTKEIIDGVEYVDLGLPSGTKWSLQYYSYNYKYKSAQRFSYDEAIKRNIPTEEQLEELKKYCRVCALKDDNGVYGIKFIGRNGNYILFHYIKINEKSNCPDNTYFFWLKSNNEMLETDLRTCATTATITREFMGYKMPLMLVKNKE